MHSSCLKEVLDAVEELSKEPKGLRGRFKEVVKLTSTKDKIAEYQNRLQTLRSNFVVRTVHLRNKPIDSNNSQLLATIDTNFHVQKLTMVPSSMISHFLQDCSNLSHILLQTFLYPKSFKASTIVLLHEYFTEDRTFLVKCTDTSTRSWRSSIFFCFMVLVGQERHRLLSNLLKSHPGQFLTAYFEF